MIITLPSNGLFGLHQTVLNTPKLGHIRSINSASYTDEQLKTEFVRMLLERPEDLSKILRSRSLLLWMRVLLSRLRSVGMGLIWM